MMLLLYDLAATDRQWRVWNDILTSEKLLLALGCLRGLVERSAGPRFGASDAIATADKVYCYSIWRQQWKHRYTDRCHPQRFLPHRK